MKTAIPPDAPIPEQEVLDNWPMLSLGQLRKARAAQTISWTKGPRGSAWYRPSEVNRFIDKITQGSPDLLAKLEAERNRVAVIAKRIARINGGAVYFVRSRYTRRIKIGFGKNVRRRIATLQTSCPEPLDLIAVMAGGKGEERSLHRRFAAYREIGEWFVPHQELVSYIERIMA